MQNIRNVEQLLTLCDVPLVEALYARLLQRKADPEELEFYIGQLRKGYGKNELIVDFAALPEVIAKGLALSGLPQYLARQRRLRRSIWRILSRGRRYESQLNRLENNLGRVVQELDALQQQTQQWLAAMESLMNLAASDGAVQPAAPSTANPEGADLSGVSASVRRIFREVTQEVHSASSRDQM